MNMPNTKYNTDSLYLYESETNCLLVYREKPWHRQNLWKYLACNLKECSMHKNSNTSSRLVHEFDACCTIVRAHERSFCKICLRQSLLIPGIESLTWNIWCPNTSHDCSMSIIYQVLKDKDDSSEAYSFNHLLTDARWYTSAQWQWWANGPTCMSPLIGRASGCAPAACSVTMPAGPALVSRSRRTRNFLVLPSDIIIIIII